MTWATEVLPEAVPEARELGTVVKCPCGGELWKNLKGNAVMSSHCDLFWLLTPEGPVHGFGDSVHWKVPLDEMATLLALGVPLSEIVQWRWKTGQNA